MIQNSEFYKVDYAKGIIEITIEVSVNGYYKDKKVTFHLDREKDPWKFEGHVESLKIEVPVPLNALHNDPIKAINLPETVSPLSEKRIIDALEEFLDLEFK